MITEEVMKQLSDFRKDADLETFQRVFGEVMGEHLWYKWNSVEQGDLLKLWDVLTAENRQKLLDHFNAPKKRIPKLEVIPP